MTKIKNDIALNKIKIKNMTIIKNYITFRAEAQEINLLQEVRKPNYLLA